MRNGTKEKPKGGEECVLWKSNQNHRTPLEKFFGSEAKRKTARVMFADVLAHAGQDRYSSEKATS